ncbi:MAG: methyltransferase domain-containing protein [Chloroflexi bacterium]|nr:methyltransferase domain-containing protein [Chloroflexota bacterium]
MESGARRVQEQYSRQAQYYSISRTHATGDTLSLLLEWGQPEPAFRVLDIATGTGFTAFTFAPHVAQVVAYDLTQEMLREAVKLAGERDLANLQYVQGLAERLPFPDATFDLVTCRTAPHHFDSIPDFVREARRVTRPGGRVLVADTSSPEDPELFRWMNHVEKLRDPSHVENRTPEEWRQVFAAAGLVVEALDTEHRVALVFSDWVRRSGTPPEVVEELRRLYRTASRSAQDAFEIRPLEDGDFTFSWMITVLAGRRP